MVKFNGMQFRFVSGGGDTDAICIGRQLQQKYIAANKHLDMNFIFVKKAFKV
jgi:hypothetical protein